MPADRSTDTAPTQLVLVTPILGDPAIFAGTLEAALAGGAVAAVIARFEPCDDRTLVNRVKALAPLVQGRGAALMVEAPVEVAARAGADGIHLAYAPEQLTDAVSRLAPQRMVGVGGLRSRDDAMAAGEAGADYVMFGEPIVSRHAEKNGQMPPFAAVVERVGWWAELFEVPVVGLAQDIDGVAALARVRADFAALGEPVWSHPDGPAAAVAAALALIAAETPA